MVKDTVFKFIKKNYIWILIVLLFLAIRIPALTQDVYGDELYNYYYSYTTYTPNVAIDPTAYSSFFMSIIFYKLAYLIYPAIISLRIFSLLFGLGILLLGMKTLDDFFNRKAAIIFGVFYALVPWAVFTSVLLDNDGTITSFMFMVLIYYSLRFFHQDKSKSKSIIANKPLIIIGIVSGAMILLKYALFASVIVFYILMLAYYLIHIKKMSFVKSLKPIGVYVASAVISTILMLAVYGLCLGPTSVSFLIKHYADIPHNNFAFGGISLVFMLQVMLILMILSPLVFVFFLKLFNPDGDAKKGSKSIKDRYLILLSIFYICELLALLYVYNSASINRYASFLIIPILLLSAIFLSRYLDNRQIWLMTLYSFMLSVLYFIIDLLPHRIIDFYPKTEWITNVVHLRWNFLVPINGASGPLGLYISFICLAFSLIVCAALFLVIFIKHSVFRSLSPKTLGKLLLVLSIVALSYCVYVSLQFSYSVTSPSIDSINHQLRVECAPQGHTDSYYVFRNSAGFLVQNKQLFLNVKSLSHEQVDNSTLALEVVNSGKDVCVVDFPQLKKSSILWTSLNDECILKKTYSSHGRVLGYWFKC